MCFINNKIQGLKALILFSCSYENQWNSLRKYKSFKRELGYNSMTIKRSIAKDLINIFLSLF